MASKGDAVREKLLELLQKNTEGYTSGEDVSRMFSISRAAVSKHVGVLRAQGHEIEAVTRKGYRLLHKAELLTEDIVQQGLKTKIFGQRGVHYLPSVGSTNIEAMQLAFTDAPEGTVVVADEQTGGRGRQGRTWHSPLGCGLYVSVVLRPDIAPNEAPIITLLTNVAAAEAVYELVGILPVCKWPNDVLIEGCKIAGNLTEIFLSGDAVGHIVSGVGINVRPLPKKLVPDLRTAPCSLEGVAGKSISRVELLQAYLVRYEHWYMLVKEQGFAPLLTRWKELTDVVGKELTVQVRGETIKGTVTDVSTDGMLLLRSKNGVEHRLFSGDIL
ncbi:biotin--[acetyl-CoA-carboxylase] ligase [Halodesulfovibrio sp. MK-HDV]|uniref:biotin--[acetyl-CoA-carboxylase] ligase n=1 Tax=Halodesulfovibrio sp. MK-HDV TaxID=2599925 RepID=UPI00136EFF1E|nr:biotin--[acetyl-CoA-carboxylase] ligase [Halodesulfovibrio sp. MK-HDV]KAF1073787.1 Bifunctional ligase/repressor BirA [Halodesulfovibrio sp. MK-HDV]